MGVMHGHFSYSSLQKKQGRAFSSQVRLLSNMHSSVTPPSYDAVRAFSHER